MFHGVMTALVTPFDENGAIDEEALRAHIDRQIKAGEDALVPAGTTGVTGTRVMLISSTGLLIVVGVVLDTMRQLEAQLQMRHYDKFLRKGILG